LAGTAQGSGRQADNKIAGTTTKKTLNETIAELWLEDGGSGGFQDVPTFLKNNIKAANKHRSVERRKFLDNSPYVGRFGDWEAPDGSGGRQVKRIDYGNFYFLRDCCYTFEEVSGRVLKLCDPDTMSEEYFLALCYIAARWQTEYFLAIPKSRRMLISWISRCQNLWYALLHPGQSIYVASLDLEKSEEMVYRIKHLISNIPTDCIPKSIMPLVEYNRGMSKPGRHDLINRVTIRHSAQESGVLDSFIQAVAASDDLRGVGASEVDLEEFAFMKQGMSMWAGLTGTLIGSGVGEKKTQGRIVMVSTPNSPSHMSDIVRDRLKAA